MKQLVVGMTAKTQRRKRTPLGFEEVVISRLTGWNYWEVVTQPMWFIEKLLLYIQAERTAQGINQKQTEMGFKAKKVRGK